MKFNTADTLYCTHICTFYVKGVVFCAPAAPPFSPPVGQWDAWVMTGLHFGKLRFWVVTSLIQKPSKSNKGPGWQGPQAVDGGAGKDPMLWTQGCLTDSGDSFWEIATPSSLKRSSRQKHCRFVSKQISDRSCCKDRLVCPSAKRRDFFFFLGGTFQEKWPFFCVLNAWISYLPEVVWTMNNLNGLSFV